MAVWSMLRGRRPPGRLVAAFALGGFLMLVLDGLLERADRPPPPPPAAAAPPPAPPSPLRGGLVRILPEGPTSLWDRHFGRQEVAGTVDPNTWVYTRAFAERFGMPEGWVSDELSGAEAVAFRGHFDGTWDCGYLGAPSACTPNFSTVFEVYVRDDVPLPWVGDLESEYQRLTTTSAYFLVRLEARKNNAPRVNRLMQGLSAYDLTQHGLSAPILFEPVERGRERDTEGDHPRVAFLFAYDRTVVPGLVMLTIKFSPHDGAHLGRAALMHVLRPSPELVEAARTVQPGKIRPPQPYRISGDLAPPIAHSVFLPRSFMDRAREVEDRLNAMWFGAAFGAGR